MYLEVCAALGLMVAFMISAWHLRNGRVITLFNAYLALTVIEFGGGIAKQITYQQTHATSLLVRATEYRCIALGAVAAGYLATISISRLPSSEVARINMRAILKARWNARVRRRLTLVASILLIIVSSTLLYKIYKAGGISTYLASMYQWRFGTGANDENATVWLAAASLASMPLAAIAAVLAQAVAVQVDSQKIRLRLGVVVLMQLGLAGLHGRRMGVIAVLGVPLAVWLMQRPPTRRALSGLIAATVVTFVAMNWIHYKLYEMTADWDGRSIVETIAISVPPQAQLETLASVLECADRNNPIGLDHYTNTIGSVVPRLIWESKPLASESGTLAIQSWSELPTHYQMAVTDVGEAIASLGEYGIGTLALLGIIYAIFDRCLFADPIGRAVVIGVCLPRVMADQGMGASAVVLTILGFMAAYAILQACFMKPSRLGGKLP